MTTGCVNLATEAVAARHWPAVPRRRTDLACLTGAALMALAAPVNGAPARAPSPAARPPQPAAAAMSPADLERHLEKAESALGKAEGAVSGRDPGRVSLLLKRIDDELGIFEVNARFAPLAGALDGARAAARRDDLRAARTMLQTARSLYPPLADYAVLQQTEESSRAALRAAEGGDGADCLASIDRFEASLRPGLLLKRVGEARQAITRTRLAMVRNDMKAGVAELRAARHAINGLRYAGALSRAQYGLRVGADLLEQQALMAARDQVQKALRSLRAAADLGAHGPDASDLGSTRDSVAKIWRRMTRAQGDDAHRLFEAATTVEAIRRRLE